MNKKRLKITLLCASIAFINLLNAMQNTSGMPAPDRMARQDSRWLAFNVRMNDATQQTILQPANDINIQNNGDEQDLPDYVGNFTKLFEHDPVTGVLTENGIASYQQYLKALNSGLQPEWNLIQRAPETQRLFINPQAGFAFSMEGADSAGLSVPVAPKMSSPEAAADLIEVYLMAYCRDVKFNEYGTGQGTDNDGNGGSKTNTAAAFLNQLGSAYKGPRNLHGQVDASVLFRGSSPANLVGQYISQFFLLDIPYSFPAGCAGNVSVLIGVQNLPQWIFNTKQLYPIPGGREFGVTWNDFISIQNGLIPQQYVFTDYNALYKQYVINGRMIGGFVHIDSPYDAYYNAMYILSAALFPISPVFPYSARYSGPFPTPNEAAGIDMGGADAFALVGAVSLEAFKCVWAQKWRADRRLRPEAMAGWVQQAVTTETNPYNLDSSLIDNVELLQLIKNYNGLQASYYPLQPASDYQTYLLSQMFPEGSPTHPSFPQGHGTVGAACTTVIKAIFDDTALISSRLTPVMIDPTDSTQLVPLNDGSENIITVGSELDKLASNIAYARCFAGVHYRSDTEAALQLGEQVAIRYLQSHARTYCEEGFTGFVLTKRDGTRIQITPTAVTEIVR